MSTQKRVLFKYHRRGVAWVPNPYGEAIACYISRHVPEDMAGPTKYMMAISDTGRAQHGGHFGTQGPFPTQRFSHFHGNLEAFVFGGVRHNSRLPLEHGAGGLTEDNDRETQRRVFTGTTPTLAPQGETPSCRGRSRRARDTGVRRPRNTEDSTV